MEMFKDNPYPRMMFGDGGTQKQVNNIQELNAALADGWRENYTHQDYPKMVTTADGRRVKVNNSEEHSSAVGAQTDEPEPEAKAKGKRKAKE